MKVILRFVFWYYLNWSKLYQWFQRRQISYDYNKKHSELKIKKAYEYVLPFIKGKSDFAIIREVWQLITLDLKWKRDGLTMLWDAIPDPYMVIKNDGDDCDGFAILANYSLKDLCMNKLQYSWTSVGIWFLIGAKCQGHAIQVMKTILSDECIVISNQEVLYFKTEKAMVEYMCKTFFNVKWIVKVSRDLSIISIEDVK